jgi:hypothetical protein
VRGPEYSVVHRALSNYFGGVLMSAEESSEYP